MTFLPMIDSCYSVGNTSQDTDSFTQSFSTLDCYTQNIALDITKMIQERFENYADKEFEIHTCLQEAILNAMIHGNLNVEGKFKEVRGFEVYQAKIEKRLKLKKYSSKLVNISVSASHKGLKISVNDGGEGFSLPKNIGNDSLDDKPYGRGLKLINSMADTIWVGADKRTLNMVFK